MPKRVKKEMKKVSRAVGQGAREVVNEKMAYKKTITNKPQMAYKKTITNKPQMAYKKTITKKK